MANQSAYVQERPYRIATGGITTAGMAAIIDARLAASVGVPKFVLINLGANDSMDAGSEAAWKTNMGYIVDAIHVAYPSAKVYLTRVWLRAAGMVNCDRFAGWIADLCAARPGWLLPGVDERVFLENGDDGATYTSDGLHPNAAGYALEAARWRTVLGF